MTATMETTHATSIEATCAGVVALNTLMAEHYRKIEELAKQRDIMLAEIEAEIGTPMRAKGAQTKKVGDHLVSVGEATRLQCLCHATYLDECPDPADAVFTGAIRRLAPEPWLKVKALGAKAEVEEAA
jgi:hypothetical protein